MLRSGAGNGGCQDNSFVMYGFLPSDGQTCDVPESKKKINWATHTLAGSIDYVARAGGQMAWFYGSIPKIKNYDHLIF